MKSCSSWEWNLPLTVTNIFALCLLLKSDISFHSDMFTLSLNVFDPCVWVVGNKRSSLQMCLELAGRPKMGNWHFGFSSVARCKLPFSVYWDEQRQRLQSKSMGEREGAHGGWAEEERCFCLTSVNWNFIVLYTQDSPSRKMFTHELYYSNLSMYFIKWFIVMSKRWESSWLNTVK